VNASDQTGIHPQHQQPILEAVLSTIIYRITNTVNGKFYIGQTSRSLDVRWSEHVYRALNGSVTHFHNAIRKYGSESFTREILEVCALSQLNEREIYWVDKLTPAYNMTGGGDGSAVSLSSEARAKISAAGRLRIQSAETRAKIGASKIGKPRSDETKAKLSATRRNSSTTPRGESHHYYGKPRSLETRLKISETLKKHNRKNS
jgi:group I intron endonuclease